MGVHRDEALRVEGERESFKIHGDRVQIVARATLFPRISLSLNFSFPTTFIDLLVVEGVLVLS